MNKTIPTDWKQIKLGDFCKFTQGVQIPHSEQKDTKESEEEDEGKES